MKKTKKTITAKYKMWAVLNKPTLTKEQEDWKIVSHLYRAMTASPERYAKEFRCDFTSGV